MTSFELDASLPDGELNMHVFYIRKPKMWVQTPLERPIYANFNDAQSHKELKFKRQLSSNVKKCLKI